VTRHTERHFTSGETVRDIVICISDGLTVPFALAAGLSGAVHTTTIVIIRSVPAPFRRRGLRCRADSK